MPSQRHASGPKPSRRQASNQPDPDWDKLSQREKFIRTAREVEASETGDALDEALRKIGRAREHQP
jgi:hypothetical protein